MMKRITVLLLFSFLSACGQPVPKGSSKERDQALSQLRPSKPGYKVFYFSLDAPDSNSRNLWIDNRPICVLSSKTFCRVELSFGNHYLETIFSSDKNAYDSIVIDGWTEEMKQGFVDSVSLKLYVSEKDNGPVLVNMFLKGFTDPKLNFYSYYPFHKSKPILGKDNVLPMLAGYSYSKPKVSVVDTNYVTPQDKREWELYGNTNSVESLKKFKEKYPRNVFIGAATIRLEKKDKEEEENLQNILKRPTLKKLEKFLATNPTKKRREVAVKKLLGFLKTTKKRRAYAKKYPLMIPLLPEKEKMAMNLLLIGPENLKVAKILELSKKGFATSTLASKVKATQSPYKNFSFDEISTLKSLGLKSELINAMIDTNTNYEAEMKRAKQNKELMEKAQGVVSKSQGKIGAQDIKESPNTPVECLKLKAALKACEQTGGLFKIACDTTAKASFDCDLY